MSRIRIASRLALIVVGAIVLVQMLLAAVYFIENQPPDGSRRLDPLIGQMAALTGLIERLPASDRSLALRAASGVGFIAHIIDEPPRDIAHAEVLQRPEARLRALIGGPADRFVALSLVTGERLGGHPITRPRDLLGAHIQAVIGLTSGGYLEIQARRGITLRLLGVPIGLIAGILGFTVALAALIAVRRETRPLSDLTTAVERFGTAIEPQAIAERGAPDVRAVIRAVNAMQLRIAQLIKSRTLVLGALSHDLRTYVTRLRLRLELMPDSEARQKVNVDLDAMQSLMDDALAYARASFAGGNHKTVDLARIVRTECQMRIAQGQPVTLNDAEEPRCVQGSAAGFARVTANLIDNALAYGGRADVSLHAEQHNVELRVEDCGPGIPAGERSNVFEPFYRLETSRNRERGGAGLGLTIVRQIVESHGGQVAIEDRPSGGARVCVRLPIGAPQQPAPEAAKA